MYHNKKFRPVSTSENSEVSSELVFHYMQEGDVLTCSYSGGKIVEGHLIGIVSIDGKIEMKYHQVNDEGLLLAGECTSVPEFTEKGIRLHETWRWTSGKSGSGSSILEELVE